MDHEPKCSGHSLKGYVFRKDGLADEFVDPHVREDGPTFPFAIESREIANPTVEKRVIGVDLGEDPLRN